MTYIWFVLTYSSWTVERELEEAVHLARSAGIIFNKEPVAKIEIPSIETLHPPSLSVVDLPETGNNKKLVFFKANHALFLDLQV